MQITARCDDIEDARSKMALWKEVNENFGNEFVSLMNDVEGAANISTSLAVCRDKLAEQKQNVDSMMVAVQATTATFSSFLSEIAAVDQGEGIVDPLDSIE